MLMRFPDEESGIFPAPARPPNSFLFADNGLISNDQVLANTNSEDKFTCMQYPSDPRFPADIKKEGWKRF